jgi:hypothetical protein
MWGALKLVEQFEFKERSWMLHWLVLVVHKLLNCFYTAPLFSWWFTWRFMHPCCHSCLLFQMTVGPRIHFYMHLMDSGPTVYMCFHEQSFFFWAKNCREVTWYSANWNIFHKFPFFWKKNSSERDRKLHFWGGCGHISVYWLQLKNFLEVMLLVQLKSA